MTNQEEQNSFFEESLKDEKRFVAIPPEMPSPYSERMPSGFDPMGQVDL